MTIIVAISVAASLAAYLAASLTSIMVDNDNLRLRWAVTIILLTSLMATLILSGDSKRTSTDGILNRSMATVRSACVATLSTDNMASRAVVGTGAVESVTVNIWGSMRAAGVDNMALNWASLRATDTASLTKPRASVWSTYMSSRA